MPMAQTGLIDRKAPGQPSRLKAEHRDVLARMIEEGPTPAIHGVVRWRIVVLSERLFEGFRVLVAEQVMSCELRKTGDRKLSACPRHQAQAEGAIEDSKKRSQCAWRKSPRSNFRPVGRSKSRPAERDRRHAKNPIGPLCKSAVKKFVDYVDEISPVLGSMVCSAVGCGCL
jgi:hypothetical protein